MGKRAGRPVSPTTIHLHAYVCFGALTCHTGSIPTDRFGWRFGGMSSPLGPGRRNGERPMTQPAKGQEPSMEEILASIRRIIADEPAKTPNDDSSRADDLRGEGPRIVGGRSDAARRALQSRGLSGPSDGLGP